MLIITTPRHHHRRHRRHYDLIKSIVLLCMLAMASMTARTLPQLQRMLDGTLYDTAASPEGGPSVSSMTSDLVTIQSLFRRRRRRQRSTQSTTTASTSSSSSSPCWQHKPLHASTTKVPHVNDTLLVQPTPAVCGALRRKSYWQVSQEQRLLHTPLAQQMAAHQANCSLPVQTFHVDNAFGLGSHLYLWSQALCNAWHEGYRVQTYNPAWLWLDQAYCRSSDDGSNDADSPLLCYFPQSEQQCPQDGPTSRTTAALSSWTNVTDPRDTKLRCPWVSDPTYLTEFRAASAEYLFHQGVSDVVIREAERQVGLLFGQEQVPSNLIAVHMRWGDKFWEMDLAPAKEYVEAVQQLLTEQEKQRNELQRTNTTTTTTDNTTTASDNTPNIYLSCEDPAAVQAFIEAAPSDWNIFVDRTVAELDAFRPTKGNRASWTAKHTHGRAGLVALGSLLVAMEADWFVVTTASNWSRLWNALRLTVLESHCNRSSNCTRLIDLRPGEW